MKSSLYDKFKVEKVSRFHSTLWNSVPQAIVNRECSQQPRKKKSIAGSEMQGSLPPVEECIKEARLLRSLSQT